MGQAISQDIGQFACFDAVVCTDTAGSRVQLRGELDLATAPQLQQLLDQLRRQGHHQITLDLSGLEFLCAAGLAVFLRADQALRAVGGRLMLTRPTRLTRRVLAVTGLDTTLTIQPAQRREETSIAAPSIPRYAINPAAPQTITTRTGRRADHRRRVRAGE